MQLFSKNLQELSFSSANIRSSLVVFLVALPLCLGIAMASGAPASSGLISAIVGGLFVGFLSPSNISVTGPAAGLSIVILAGIQQVGSFELFCAITVLAGAFQVILGLFRLGMIGSFIPSSVINGLLAAIGILIVVKQIPIAVGFTGDTLGTLSLRDLDDSYGLSSIFSAFRSISFGAVFVFAAGLLVYLFWPRFAKRHGRLSFLPSPLIAVVVGILLNEFLLPLLGFPLESHQLVQIPLHNLFQPIELKTQISKFDFSHIGLAVSLCLLASVEALLSIDASEKLDPLKRRVNSSHELIAQGLGNALSGLLGGLPLTSVIVRTSTNATSGGTSRSSTMMHALWLAVFAFTLPQLLNKIPMASLALILIVVGYKLAPIKLFRRQWALGTEQFVPFLATLVSILITDLLIGVGIGLLVGVFYVIRANLTSSLVLVNEGNDYLLRFNKDTSFFAKHSLHLILCKIPNGANLVIDGSRSIQIDYDIIDMLEDFVAGAPARNITCRIKKSSLAQSAYFKET